MTFSGAAYSEEHDEARLKTQLKRIWEVVKNQDWYTLSELESVTGDPAASISAQLRNLRKKTFGGFTVERRHRGGDKFSGLFEYRVSPPPGTSAIVYFEPVKKSQLQKTPKPRLTKKMMIDKLGEVEKAAALYGQDPTNEDKRLTGVRFYYELKEMIDRLSIPVE